MQPLQTGMCAKAEQQCLETRYLERSNDGARKKLTWLPGCLMEQGYSLKDALS